MKAKRNETKIKKLPHTKYIYTQDSDINILYVCIESMWATKKYDYSRIIYGLFASIAVFVHILNHEVYFFQHYAFRYFFLYVCVKIAQNWFTSSSRLHKLCTHIYVHKIVGFLLILKDFQRPVTTGHCYCCWYIVVAHGWCWCPFHSFSMEFLFYSTTSTPLAVNCFSGHIFISIVYSTLFNLNILVYLNCTLYHFKQKEHFRPLVIAYIPTNDVGIHSISGMQNILYIVWRFTRLTCTPLHIYTNTYAVTVLVHESIWFGTSFGWWCYFALSKHYRCGVTWKVYHKIEFSLLIYLLDNCIGFRLR